MADQDKEKSFNILSELTQVLKTLAKKINGQWTAMASFLAVLVTILCLTLLKSSDQDKNEDHILLTIVLFFSIILILGALLLYRGSSPQDEPAVEKKSDEDNQEILSGKEAFISFYSKIAPETLQYKILKALQDQSFKTLPQLSDTLGVNTPAIRKSADRLTEKGFLESKVGDKPKHISYSLSYPLPK